MGRRWRRALLALCLRSWPRRERERTGSELLDTAEALIGEAFDRGRLAGIREWLGEAGALLAEGMRLRVRGVPRSGATGWGGDVRFALRVLRRSPGFVAVAVLSLGLGLGANAVVFSLVDGVLGDPPSYQDPDALVVVWNTLPGGRDRIPVAAPDVAILRERVTGLRDVAFTIRGVDGAVQTGTDEAARPVRIAAVTAGFFHTLGVAAARGRTFRPSDGPSADPADAPVAVVSHAAWRDALGGDPGVVGAEVRLNGRPVRVVGVMPLGFRLALPPDAGLITEVDVWVPIAVPLTEFHRTDGRLLDQDSDNTGAVVARRAPGVSLDRVQAEVDGVAEALRREIPFYAESGLGLEVRGLGEDATAHARPVLQLLGAGVAGVLLVTCLNLATLLLLRGLGRRRELAVRAALGATRWRLIRQLLTEGLALLAAGLAVAWILARLALELLGSRIPTALIPPEGLGLDPVVLGVGGVMASVVVLSVALMPAGWAGVREARGGVGAGIARGGSGRRRGRDVLVVLEVALSVVLVVGAGLLFRTVRGLQEVRPGFEPAGALTFNVSLRVPDTYRGPGDRAAFMQEVEAGLEALPGVDAVGLAGVLPLSGDRWVQPYGLPGQAESEWRANRADFRVVTSGYFEALGTRILEGRGFTPEEDRVEGERVVVVDRRMADRIAPGGSALDAAIGIPLDGAPVQARVVGVVEHVRHDRLEADGREAVYVPYRQEASREVAFVVRTQGDPAALAPEVRRVVRSVDPRIPVHDLRSLSAYVDRAVAPRAFALRVLLAFSALALLCAAVGLYGILAFDVRRRTRDLGLRMAVGAARLDILSHVLGVGLRLGALGLLLGGIGAAVATRWLDGLVVGVSLTDPGTWAMGAALVTAMVLAASVVPAVRATRLDPTEALRTE